MTLIPWRIKNYISDHFPLLYHLIANVGVRANSQEHWDARLAEAWDAPIAHWPTKNDLIASLTSPSETILDVGCGTGSILRHLKRRGYAHLHGLEISKYAIKRLGAEGIDMHFGTLPMIPLPNESFDVVVASQVLEHVIRRRRFIGEIRRVLKPGGRALLFVPNNCLGPIDEPEHVVKFTAHSLRNLIDPYLSIVALESMQDANHSMQVLFAHVAKRAH